MLYELIGIVRPGKIHEVKEIAKTAGSIVLNSGGVVRGVTNWGVFQLPKPFRKHQVTHYAGHHFIIRFDASPRAQHALRRTMGLDPRLIRHSVVKLGSKLEDIVDVPGVAPWGSGDAAYSSKVKVSEPDAAPVTKWNDMAEVGAEQKNKESMNHVFDLIDKNRTKY
ncbi:putative 37s ribosomal protein mrp17 protein [Lasiodiplodia theobromae]|uniref:Small ribosomal subunit protein bS6m n=1 Tax=Lasiodiplodia theobromae TaxID=45133 RepID=A0A5N5DTJ4_9PEZI|nr:37s ribosomal protein [Lasiodiplodia theobromae]KAB2581305.1 37S ribosomal protein MRP17 [Lasiodiplodia theobromae]KAF4539884.1 37s ribosomal protein [Lasiodiplodia theobromae]KAF9629499.1 putative 37s ribosomal protein mrp17 protein [Lasiodiplodia theobromae]